VTAMPRRGVCTSSCTTKAEPARSKVMTGGLFTAPGARELSKRMHVSAMSRTRSPPATMVMGMRVVASRETPNTSSEPPACMPAPLKPWSEAMIWIPSLLRLCCVLKMGAVFGSAAR
jgi:hypothetical protein